MQKIKLLFLLSFFTSVSSFAQAKLTLKAECDFIGKTNGGVLKSSFGEQVLSSEGQNSTYLPMTLTWDDPNGILVSMNHTSNVCADSDCTSYEGKTYTVSMVRVVNDTRAALSLKEVKKSKGSTAKTMEVTSYNDGTLGVSFKRGDEVVYDAPELPKEFAIEYKVGKQDIKVNCLFTIL